jgi:hypothetical protein
VGLEKAKEVLRVILAPADLLSIRVSQSARLSKKAIESYESVQWSSCCSENFVAAPLERSWELLRLPPRRQ